MSIYTDSKNLKEAIDKIEFMLNEQQEVINTLTEYILSREYQYNNYKMED